MKSRIFFIVLMVMLLLSSFLFAQKPDFSGTWELDTQQSRLPGMMLNTSADNRIIITHNEPEIKIVNIINSQQGRIATETSMKLNGEYHKRKGRLGQEMLYKGYWADNGKDLIIESENTRIYRGRQFTIKTKQVFTLSEDGEVITCDQSTTTRDGTVTARLYYVRRKQQEEK